MFLGAQCPTALGRHRFGRPAGATLQVIGQARLTMGLPDTEEIGEHPCLADDGEERSAAGRVPVGMDRVRGPREAAGNDLGLAQR